MMELSAIVEVPVLRLDAGFAALAEVEKQLLVEEGEKVENEPLLLEAAIAAGEEVEKELLLEAVVAAGEEVGKEQLLEAVVAEVAKELLLQAVAVVE